jgi:deoxyribonuclease-4
VGVCFDTCHVWDGGYDIVNDLDGVLSEFDRIIGLDRLKAIHFNDSMNDCGSHKDRHQKIGEGHLGLEAMKRVVCHPLLQGKPFILETPNDDAGYAKEIALVREFMLP